MKNEMQGGSAFGVRILGPEADGRVYFTVPFAEKDEAQRLGAKWDTAVGSWYAPAGADMARFSRWGHVGMV